MIRRTGGRYRRPKLIRYSAPGGMRYLVRRGLRGPPTCTSRFFRPLKFFRQNLLKNAFFVAKKYNKKGPPHSGPPCSEGFSTTTIRLGALPAH